MLPLGHVAYTWAGLAWLQSLNLLKDIDYRGAAVAALLPDLIDKPLSLTVLSNAGTSQGLSHTLLAHAVLDLTIARLKPDWLPYALVVNSHLVADQMWKYPNTVLFPFSRQFDSWKFMGTPSAMLSAYAEIALRPAIVAVEAAGVALLAWTVWKHEIHRKGSLKRFLLKGRIPNHPSSPPQRGTERSTEAKNEPCES
jgi:hypothetical protein